VLRNPRAHDAAKPPLKRVGDLLDMRERQADLLTSGDHDAFGIEQTKAGERHLLDRDKVGRESRDRARRCRKAGGGRENDEGELLPCFFSHFQGMREIGLLAFADLRVCLGYPQK
jgi:hypothetical protein